MLRKIFSGYSFYSMSSLLRLALFYYVAVHFGKSSFIAYNKYVFYSEIAMILVCSGTRTAFTIKNGSENKLASAIFFENSAMFFVFALAFSLFFAGAIHFGISFPLLIFIIFLRTNNQIFSRYFLFEKSIVRSVINDILGNYLWAALILILALFFHFKNIKAFIWLWCILLAFNNAVNFYLFRKNIFNFKGIFGWPGFTKIYFQSVQFTLVNTLFGNLDKVIVIHKYTVLAVVSAYLISSKVMGFFTNISTNFAGLFLSNNLKYLDKTSHSRNKFFMATVLINLVLYMLIFIVLYLTSGIIQNHLANQLAKEYADLMFLIIPLYAINNLRSLSGIYFQRHRKMIYLNIISFFKVVLLVLLFFLNISIYRYVFVETAGLGLMLFCDIWYWNMLETRVMISS